MIKIKFQEKNVDLRTFSIFTVNYKMSSFYFIFYLQKHGKTIKFYHYFLYKSL